MVAMKTYIFDYNGTILNDAGHAAEIENIMLEERGLPYGYTLEDYRSMFDTDMIHYYRQIGYTFETETFEDVAKQFNALYRQRFPLMELCEGVLPLLQKIQENHDQAVILSSCQDAMLKEQCEELGIASMFREIMGIDNFLAGSKVDIAKHWMIRSAVHPDECVYFGDTLADYSTAKAIGVENIILVASGHQSYTRLAQVCPSVIHSLKEYKVL